jgi:hypothetical protein
MGTMIEFMKLAVSDLGRVGCVGCKVICDVHHSLVKLAESTHSATPSVNGHQ